VTLHVETVVSFLSIKECILERGLINVLTKDVIWTLSIVVLSLCIYKLTLVRSLISVTHEGCCYVTNQSNDSCNDFN
jgi:hypothetical protein